ncbi:MAG: hypothetical protein GX749_04970 [Ruminococcaceae bacterium]|nr:hypothetical protein [Oscillospiraceae bacterium]
MQNVIELKSEMDRLFSSLGGVIAARAIFNDDEEIVEIHILSDLTKSPKQLSRDIQSAAMAAFGLNIDYKLISIAQVDSEVVNKPAVQISPRLSIGKILIGLDNQSLESTVFLTHGDKVFEGSSSGPLATRSRVNATAAAAIQALKKFFGPNISISLIEYQRQTIGGTDCYTVALSWSDGVRESVRYGIAPLCGPESEIKAIVRAILSAVNRAVSFCEDKGS